MKYLIAIEQYGSISAAADALYTAQPSLTQAVKTLEKELGIPLLIRDHRKVVLSEAGKVFCDKARKILAETEQLQDLMADYGGLKKGSLRIGALWIAGYTGILSWINAYRDKEPTVDVTVDMDGSLNLIHKLLDHTLDCAFLIAVPDQMKDYPSLSFRKVVEDEYVIVTSKQNRLAKRKTLTLKDLEGENVILPSSDSPLRIQLENAFNKEKIHINVMANVTQSDSVIQMAANNMAVGFSSKGICEYFKQENIVPHTMKPGIRRTIYFVTFRDMEQYPTIRSFMEYLDTCVK